MKPRSGWARSGLEEGMSTRRLVYAGRLIARGVEPLAACDVALVRPVTDDRDMRDALEGAVSAGGLASGSNALAREADPLLESLRC